MSLLFDALRRAQNTDNQTVPSTSAETAKSVRSSGHRPWENALPYIIATLLLLTGSTLWYYYQQTRLVTAEPAQVAIAPPAASQTPVAASVADSVASLPATGAGNAIAEQKAWTQPLDGKKTVKHKAKRKSAQPGTQTSTRQDPLKAGYQALSEGHLELAEQHYLAALAQRPHEKDALLGLAVIAHRKQQTERATDLYRQVLREDLGNAAAAAGLVSLSVHADPLAAESQLRELLDLKPTAPEFHYALGGVLARQQRWGEAQQAFFRAHSLEPGKALYAYNLAVSLDRLHQPAAALPYYEKTLQLANDPSLDSEAVNQRIQELKDSR